MAKFLLKYSKAFVHIPLWSIFFMLHLGYFSNIMDTGEALERGTILVSLFMFVFYVNWWLLIPQLYIKKRYLLYFVLCFLLLCLASVARAEVEKYYNVFPFLMRRRVFPFHPVRPYLSSFFIFIFVLVTSFFLRIADYYALQSRQKDRLQQQKTEAELKLLKAQLNPHFLFNALNNIYALVLTRSEHAASSLMSLSQLLRYIIYDAADERVSLEKEITYLKYYIELESLRLVPGAKLEIDIFDEPNKLMIMPLTFIPFIENCFKHSNINQKGYIKIELKLCDREVFFLCENSYPKISKKVDGTGGVGLVNSLKRLEAIYPQKHQISVTNSNYVFCVQLNLQL